MVPECSILSVKKISVKRTEGPAGPSHLERAETGAILISSVNSISSLPPSGPVSPQPGSARRLQSLSRWALDHLSNRSRRWGALLALCATAQFGVAPLHVPDQSSDVADGDQGGTHGSASFGGAASLGVGGSGSEGTPLMTGGESAPLLCDNDEPLDILFVGNSYTHYFQMPQLFSAMAESAGCSVNVEYVAPGGSRLSQHAVSGVTLSAIGSRDWDAVVLQNFSQLPSQPMEYVEEETLPSVMTLASAVFDNNPEASLYYYVTWGRRDGDQEYCQTSPQVCSFMGHTEALYRGYSLYRDRTGGTLADVGAAWANIYRDGRRPFSFRELYNPDGSHPSLKGSYLAASVFFATVFKASPEGLAYPLGLSRTSAEYIQKVAGRLPISGA